MTQPNLDRVIWLLEQMNADKDPISDKQVLRFGQNPDACLTEKCLMARRIVTGVHDLKLGPDNQPVYTTGDKYFVGEAEFDFQDLFREAVGEEPPPALRSSVLGFLGQKILFFFEEAEKCWVVLGDRVVGEFSTDYDDLKVSINQNHEHAIFWSSKNFKIFTLEKNGRSLVSVEGNFKPPSLFIVTVLRYQERMYIVFKDQAEVVELTTGFPTRFKLQYGQALAASAGYFGLCILVADFDGLKIFSNECNTEDILQEDKRPEEIHLKHDFLENLSMVSHDSFRYVGSMRHGQMAWCDSYRKEPAMNMVTEIFSADDGRRYWGIVGSHLFLMVTEL